MAKHRLPKGRKTRVIPIRLSDTEIEVIERAAELLGENRVAFMRATIKDRCMEVFEEFEVSLAEVTSKGGAA